MEEGKFLPALMGTASLQRWHWCWHWRLWVVSVGQDMLDPMEGGIAIKLKNNKKLAVGKGS